MKAVSLQLRRLVAQVWSVCVAREGEKKKPKTGSSVIKQARHLSTVATLGSGQREEQSGYGNKVQGFVWVSERDRKGSALFFPVRRNWTEFNTEVSLPLVSFPKSPQIAAGSWKCPSYRSFFPPLFSIFVICDQFTNDNKTVTFKFTPRSLFEALDSREPYVVSMDRSIRIKNSLHFEQVAYVGTALFTLCHLHFKEVQSRLSTHPYPTICQLKLCLHAPNFFSPIQITLTIDSDFAVYRDAK